MLVPERANKQEQTAEPKRIKVNVYVGVILINFLSGFYIILSVVKSNNFLVKPQVHTSRYVLLTSHFLLFTSLELILNSTSLITHYILALISPLNFHFL
jgi:hypothetical protein